jgi:hypothetical protein
MTGREHYEMAEHLLDVVAAAAGGPQTASDLKRLLEPPPTSPGGHRTATASAIPVSQGPTQPPRASRVLPGPERQKQMIATAQVHAILALAAGGLPTAGR